MSRWESRSCRRCRGRASGNGVPCSSCRGRSGRICRSRRPRSAPTWSTPGSNSCASRTWSAASRRRNLQQFIYLFIYFVEEQKFCYNNVIGIMVNNFYIIERAQTTGPRRLWALTLRQIRNSSFTFIYKKLMIVMSARRFRFNRLSE